MRITRPEILDRDDIREISAVIDGFRLWYRVPRSCAVSGAADPFLAAAMLPAMLEGRKLTFAPGASASPLLLGNLETLQDIHHCWNPAFKVIPVEAETAPARPANDGALSFFSGGVDSSYTFLKKQGEITHLVFAQGFDFFANPGGTGAFSAEDLADLSQLAFRLLLPAGALSAYLKGSLSENTRQALSDYRSSGLPSPGLEALVARDLEALIAGPPLWEEKRFSGVRLRPGTRELLRSGPGGENAHRLNRSLLEDAFPQEIARRDDSAYRESVGRNARFAESHGKTLIPVATNHYAFGYRYNLSRNLTQGSALASIALLLGFPLAYVPAAYSYSQLTPLGSHPLTDPLWSNEAVRIVHEGAEARRVDKVARIAGSGPVLANLRVCFEDMNRNCGRCAKCLRTMIPLALMGISGAPFPPLPPPKGIRRMRIANDIESIFLKESLDAAPGAPKGAIYRALRACIRRFERQKLARDLDKVVLGGMLRKAYLRRAGSGAFITRIDTKPPN